MTYVVDVYPLGLQNIGGAQLMAWQLNLVSNFGAAGLFNAKPAFRNRLFEASFIDCGLVVVGAMMKWLAEIYLQDDV